MDTDPLGDTTLVISDLLNNTALWYFLLLIALLALSAFMSGSETALFSLTKSEIEDFKDSKNSSENTLFSLLKHPERLLATILIANNFINIAIVLIFEYLLRTYIDFGGHDILRIFISVVLTTFLLLLFGEVMPKVYATSSYKSFSRFVAMPMKILVAFLRILSAPLILLNKGLEKLFSHKSKDTLSVDRLSQALEMTQDDTESEDDKRILEGIVSFGKTEAKQVMTPRTDVFSVDDTCPFDRLKRLILKQGYSRIPVYHENPDNIRGILYIKDLLAYLKEKDYPWQKLLRAPHFVPENRKIDDILVDFQEKKNHMAVVVDEYGGTSGIITMDDILEEIVGSISDEFDTEEEEGYTQDDDTHFTFEGNTQLVDFYRILDLDDDTVDMFEQNKGEADSLAGFILETNGAFPKKGQEIVAFGRYVFTVSAIDRKRIKEIKLTIAPQEITPEDED
ncbi:MAG: gliding motility-associated protein GldE [Flavobacteriales bacterium]|nr:gliding motility-associated protein GldE [Flavobacteriales bacterium]